MKRLLLAVFLTAPLIVYAEVPKMPAVYSIIGEAEAENFRGKLAVACAIRNRGSLKGVYGLNSKRVRDGLYSSKTFVEAVRAWEDSAHYNQCTFIKGATGWGNDNDLKIFARSKWWKNAVITVRIGNHTFYK